jgi:hypothetical protein
MIEVCLRHWLFLSEEDTPFDSPKSYQNRGKENKTTLEQYTKASLEVMTKK